MIGAFTQAGLCDTALYLFQQIQKEGIEPDLTSIVCIMKACGCVAALEQGKIIHGYVIKRGFEMDVHVGSALICMYVSCGRLDDGVDVFEGLQAHNVVVFNAMITGFAKNNNFSLALKTYSAMEGCECKPNRVTYLSLLTTCSNLGLVKDGCDLGVYVIKRGFEMDVHVCSALICMYASCGSLDDGVFEVLQARNVVVFNAMITGFAKNNNFSLALKTYSAMEGCECKPNGVTYLSLLTACSNLGLVKEGCDLFKSMKEHVNLLGLDHYNTLVDIFGHAGLLLYSEDLLETIPFQANPVGWLSLLSSC
ncbi:hypothetical protein KP509_17G031900 [Ceratopteris richardii]|uniref:Pentatricopeptide repeat-containing protein n=1 Tax=Ceratopteris richardii TaxID=49495 RepID=A0A8T2SV71_CERRI|nr:hypothetical protein KP509_17G031900 [Ceratopteris richardii]